MADYDISDQRTIPFVARIEHYYTPKCVQQNHAQRLSCTRQEKHFIFVAHQTNCAWSSLKPKINWFNFFFLVNSSWKLTESARMLTSANAPLMMPKPKPETYDKICLLSMIRELSATSLRPFSVLRRTLYNPNLNASCKRQKPILQTTFFLCQNEWQITWIKTEQINPIDVYDLSGTKTNQINDENNNAQSQTNAAPTRRIIRIGSLATVSVNIANGGPNAKNVQPKNSGSVISI